MLERERSRVVNTYREPCRTLGVLHPISFNPDDNAVHNLQMKWSMEKQKELGVWRLASLVEPQPVISELGSKKINLSKPQFPYLLYGFTVQMSQNFGGCSGIKESVQYNDTWTWNPWHGTDWYAFPQSSSCVLRNVGPGDFIGKVVERIHEVGCCPYMVLFFSSEIFS